MKKALSIFALIIMGLGLLAQEAETAAKPKPTLDELRDSISKVINDFFDEILDFEVAEAALQARQISNVGYGLDNALFQNGELRDTFEVLRQVLQSELFIKSAVHYDHFWTRLIERSNYSPRDAELENRYGDGLYDNRIYFDVVFTPAWDTLKMDVDAAREVGSIAWECSIDLHGVGTFRAEFSDKEMERLAGEPVSGHKYGNIGTGARPDVNMGVMGSLGWLAEKFGYSPADDTTNVRYVRFYALNANDRTFDAPGNALLGGNYDNTPVEGRKYLAPWQSAAGNAQTLYAHVERKDKKNGTGDTLAFKTTAGAPVSAERLNDTTYRLSLPGLAALGGQGIQATYSYTGSDGREKAVFAGQVNIAENKAQKMDLVLVEVNENTLGEPAKAVQDTLNAIYKPAGVTWTVRKEPLKVKSKSADTDNLDDGETQVLTNYTGDMDAVIDAYRKVYGKPDKNTCYLFLVGRAKSGTGKCGYMPLKRQFGFIFTKSACGSKGELKRTVAHELGHGPFRLYHTFSAHSQYVQPEGETDNLMDYSNGTRTRKYQWDLIHDPQKMLFAFMQDESEGALVAEDNVEGVARFIRSFHCAKNKGKSSELLYLGKSQYEIKIADLAEELGILNPPSASQRIKFTFGEDASAGTDYFQDVFDIKNVEYDDKNKWVKIKGQELALTVRWIDYNTPEKDNVYSFIKSLFNGTKTIKMDDGKPDELSVDELEYCSICTFEKIGIERRKKLLSEISGYNWIYDPQEKVVINLVNSCPAADKLTLFNYLKGDAALVGKLYDGVDDYRKEFMNSLFVLYGSVKDKATGINHVAYAKLGCAVKEDGSKGVFRIYRKKGTTAAEFSGTGINFILKEKLLIESEWSLPGLFKNQNGETIFTASPFDIIETELTSIEIGKFYTNVTQSEVAIQLPAVYVKYLLDEQISQLTKNELSVLGDAGMNIAMFVVGVGELKAGVTALKATTNAQGVIRLVLGSADLLAFGASNYCDGSTTEFCKAYKEYEFYINLGLLSGSVLNNVFPDLYTRLKNSYKDVPMSAQERKLFDDVFEEGAVVIDDMVGTYTTKIKWGIHDIDARPFEKGYWGKRISQSNSRVDAYELKINPNNESFYLPHPEGGYVQFENIVKTTVQDGKLIMDQSSIYHVLEKPEFLIEESVLKPALRQIEAARSVGYKVEWIVSDEKALQQLTKYFQDKNISITVKLLKE